METAYYRESNGDYFAIFVSLFRHDGGQVIYDGRAAAIAGLPTSVCTPGIGSRYLKGCERVKKDDVPSNWLASIG